MLRLSESVAIDFSGFMDDTFPISLWTQGKALLFASEIQGSGVSEVSRNLHFQFLNMFNFVIRHIPQMSLNVNNKLQRNQDNATKLFPEFFGRVYARTF